MRSRSFLVGHGSSRASGTLTAFGGTLRSIDRSKSELRDSCGEVEYTAFSPRGNGTHQVTAGCWTTYQSWGAKKPRPPSSVEQNFGFSQNRTWSSKIQSNDKEYDGVDEAIAQKAATRFDKYRIRCPSSIAQWLRWGELWRLLGEILVGPSNRIRLLPAARLGGSHTEKL